MNKPLFRYITVVAILAVVALQGMWFSSSYRLLENELYDKVNNAFLETQYQEASQMSKRFKGRIPNGTEIRLDSTKSHKKGINSDKTYLVTAFHNIHHKYGIPLNYHLLDSLYRNELSKANLGKLHFRIDSIEIDTTRYRYIEDFDEDSTLVRLHNCMQTQIYPTLNNFAKGIQATIDNPYQSIIEDLTEKFIAKAEKPIEFILHLKEEKVYVNEEFLKEAISNLIDNAVKYSRESVCTEIASRFSADGYTQVSVKDNGMGIPLKEQGKIFEKYERASAMKRNRKGGASGFGLGLNDVFHVAQAHHGNVKLESIEGEYSDFTINIPQQNEETA